MIIINQIKKFIKKLAIFFYICYNRIEIFNGGNMANIKSAKKRILIEADNNARNNAVKSEIKTYIKKFDTAVSQGNIEEATALYSEVSSRLDSAARDNVIHKKTASRKKAHLAKVLNATQKA